MQEQAEHLYKKVGINHLNFKIMKKVKVIMPFMAFVMAIGLAFANTAEVKSGGWVERNGSPYQLKNAPCTGSGYTCKVIFANDPDGTEHAVYMNQNLQTPKPSGTQSAYIINE